MSMTVLPMLMMNQSENGPFLIIQMQDRILDNVDQYFEVTRFAINFVNGFILKQFMVDICAMSRSAGVTHCRTFPAVTGDLAWQLSG
ncbi:hypothetical protein [Novosphingobium taihuense]|uniref:Uncharacterized protein n=2 Tax=Novosphingobium taihuense TaxID=260085 RepID=A0A7W7EU08_9SPHN|nr:hypothetical protein [Novosphingobium taihuense]MBB4613441.1 hypothetical protein [Novosphingobium taihuense]